MRSLQSQEASNASERLLRNASRSATLWAWCPQATAKAAQDGVAPYTSLFFAGYKN